MTPELDAARGDGPKVIDGEVVETVPPTAAAPSSAPGRKSGGGSAGGTFGVTRGLLGLRAAVLVVLILATAIFGTLFVRERSARDDERRHMRAQSARLAQRSAVLSAELAVVRAQRDRLVRVAQTQSLSPAAVAAVRACVQHYAELERALTAPGGVAPSSGVACINAEPYVR